MAELETHVQELYVRALIAIARADREIDAAEGDRLDAVVRRRFPTVSVAELLFETSVRPDDIVQGLGAAPEGGPYRNTKIEPRLLGQMFVTDALEIVAASNGLSSAEESAVLRFAPLFGLPEHEVRRALAGVR